MLFSRAAGSAATRIAAVVVALIWIVVTYQSLHAESLPTQLAALSSLRATQRCFGETATIVGTERADELTGTRGRDIIVGGGGGDRIAAGEGRDLVCGAAGDDFVRAGPGSDKVDAGRAGDAVHGGSGNDLVYTRRGSVEALFGGAGNDRLFGGAGNFDGLIGGPGDDVMNGGDGLDTAEFWDSPSGVQADLRSDTDPAMETTGYPKSRGWLGRTTTTFSTATTVATVSSARSETTF